MLTSRKEKSRSNNNGSDLTVFFFGGGGIEWPLNISNNWWFCRERSGNPSSRGSGGDGLHQPDYTDCHGAVEEASQTRWDKFITRKHTSTSLSLLKVVSLMPTFDVFKIFLQNTRTALFQQNMLTLYQFFVYYANIVEYWIYINMWQNDRKHDNLRYS